MLDNIITEAVRKNLSREWWDSDPGTLPLQDIPKVLEVTISSPYRAVLKLEGWYIRPTDYFVVGIHAPRCAMCLGILDLLRSLVKVENCEEGSVKAYFDFEKVFWRPIDFLEGLLAGIGHGLHRSKYESNLQLLDRSEEITGCCDAG